MNENPFDFFFFFRKRFSLLFVENGSKSTIDKISLLIAIIVICDPGT